MGGRLTVAQSWRVENEFQAREFCRFVMEHQSEGLTFAIKPKPRTPRQNAGIHAYLAELAEALNAHGLDCRTVLADGHPIPWTPELAKEHLWRPVQVAMFDIESTADLATNQVGQVYEQISRRIASVHGVDVPFGNNPTPTGGYRGA